MTRKVLIMAVLCLWSATAKAAEPTWTSMYRGVDRAIVTNVPLVNALRIDLSDPTIVCHSTPSNDAGSRDADTQTTGASRQPRQGAGGG